MNNLQETLNQFLDDFYPNNAVQKSRWKQRLQKDPSEMKGSDLTMYNLLLFASRRNGGENKDVQEVREPEIPSTYKELKDWVKKQSQSTIKKIPQWIKDNTSKHKTFNSLDKSKKELIFNDKEIVDNMLDECSDFINEEQMEELDELWDNNVNKKLDPEYDKIKKAIIHYRIKNPLYSIRHNCNKVDDVLWKVRMKTFYNINEYDEWLQLYMNEINNNTGGTLTEKKIKEGEDLRTECLKIFTPKK